MKITNYPRNGHPIAPSLLAPVLKDAFMPLGLKYSDLGPGIWAKKKPVECAFISDIVVSNIASNLQEIVEKLGKTPIAPANTPMSVFDLELEPRTWGCIYDATMKIRNRDLSKLTLEKIVELRSFGPKSIVDLLTSIDGFVKSGKKANQELFGQNRDELLTSICDAVLQCPRLAEKITDILVPPMPAGVQLTDLNVRDSVIAAIQEAGLSEAKVWAKQSIARIAALDRVGAHGIHELVTAIFEMRKSNPNAVSTTPDQDVQNAKYILEDIRTNKILTRGILRRKFPKFPSDANLYDLRLRTRTDRVLKEVAIKELSEISNLTIAQIRSLRSCGIHTIVDLLENQIRLWGERGVTGSGDGAPSKAKSVRKGSMKTEVSQVLAELKKEGALLEVNQLDPRLGLRLKSISPSALTVREIANMKVAEFPMNRHNQLMMLRDTAVQLKSYTLEEEILDLLAIPPVHNKEKYRIMIGELYGFGKVKSLTLQEVADSYTISRERVRQVCAPNRLSRLKRPAFAPTLDKVLSAASELAPMTWEEMVAELKERKLLKDKIPFSSITRFAKLMKRDCELQVLKFPNGRLIVTESIILLLAKAKKFALEQVRTFGSGSLSKVHKRFEIEEPKMQALLLRYLKTFGSFDWVGKSKDEFYLQFGNTKKKV